jgi:hypothetical protein
MAVEFTSSALGVPGGAGTKVVEQTVAFNGTVTGADIALKGFFFQFADHDDHPLRVVEARSFVIAIVGNTVRVGVLCQFADTNLDDPYTGSVEVLVIASIQ